MEYFLTNHAQIRADERSISAAAIKDALVNPTKVLYDNEGKLLIKKLYRNNGKERLLLIIGIKLVNKLKIITIIDTSKVDKYL